MGGGNRPEWSGVTCAGVFRVPFAAGRFDCFDCHYHDGLQTNMKAVE